MSEKKILSEVYNKFGPRVWRWKNGKNPNLHITSVNFLTIDLEILEIFVKHGFYKDRSQAIREYIRNGIKKDLKLIKKLEKFKNYDVNTLGLILTKERIDKIKQIRDLDLKLIDPLQEGSIQESEINKRLVKKQIIQEEN